jgi:hypothetical protein
MRLGSDAAHRMKRLAGFIFGLLTHLAVGVLAWYFPPGASLTSWAIYIGLGIVGFIQIVWGARGWVHAPRESERPAVTAAFEPDDIPYHAKACPAPGCGENLARTIARGRRRCPKCARHFSLRELGWRQVDHRGEPASYAPHEMRVKGPVMVAIVLAVFASIAVAYWGFGVMGPPAQATRPPSAPPGQTGPQSAGATP